MVSFSEAAQDMLDSMDSLGPNESYWIQRQVWTVRVKHPEDVDSMDPMDHPGS